MPYIARVTSLNRAFVFDGINLWCLTLTSLEIVEFIVASELFSLVSTDLYPSA